MPARVALAVIGAGLMGAHHAHTIAHRLPYADLIAIADPAPGRAATLCDTLNSGTPTTAWTDILRNPAVQGVVVAAPAQFHAEIVESAAHANKAVFCEKPLALTLDDADRAIAAAANAGVPLQIGFQRRFDSAYQHARSAVQNGELGSIQLLRSLTRDPEFDDPAPTPAWAIFRETLIHDFDVMRFLNPGAEPVDVFAMADALIHPDWKSRGILDTAVVTVRFSNGALATADASFQAVYGYDVRAEVFGSAGTFAIGDNRALHAVHLTPAGAHQTLVRNFTDLFAEAYTAELAHFAECIRNDTPPACTGADGRAALAMCLAAIRSVQEHRPVTLAEIDSPAAV